MQPTLPQLVAKFDPMMRSSHGVLPVGYLPWEPCQILTSQSSVPYFLREETQ